MARNFAKVCFEGLHAQKVGADARWFLPGREERLDSVARACGGKACLRSCGGSSFAAQCVLSFRHNGWLHGGCPDSYQLLDDFRGSQLFSNKSQIIV